MQAFDRQLINLITSLGDYSLIATSTATERACISADVSRFRKSDTSAISFLRAQFGEAYEQSAYTSSTLEDVVTRAVS